MKKFLVAVSLTLLISLSFLASIAPLSEGQTSFEVWSIGHTQTTITIEWNNLTPPTNPPGVVNSYFYSLYESVNGTNGPFTNVGNISAGICEVTMVNSSTAASYWYYLVAEWGSYPRTNTLQTYTSSYMRVAVAGTTETTASLSWINGDVYSNQTSFQGYTVQMLLSSGNWSTLAILSSKLDTNYTITGLSPGTTYSFRIVTLVKVATIGSIMSSPSQVATASTASLPVNHQQNGFSAADTAAVIVVLLIIVLGSFIAIRGKKK